jgi:hypothetical protein
MRTATLSMGHLYFCSDSFTFKIQLAFTISGVNMAALFSIFTEDEWRAVILFECAEGTEDVTLFLLLMRTAFLIVLRQKHLFGHF